LPSIAAGQEVSQRSIFTAPAASVSEGQPDATPAPRAAPGAAVTPTTSSEPLITPLRVLAGVALMLAVVLGILGWLKR
jgi:hypothetical protein